MSFNNDLKIFLNAYLKKTQSNKNTLSLCKTRYEQVITDAHFADFILSPSILVFNFKQDKKEQKIDIAKEEKKKGLELIKVKCDSRFLATTFKFLEKKEPFHNHNKYIYFLAQQLLRQWSDCEW